MFVITHSTHMKPLDNIKVNVTLFFKFLCSENLLVPLKARHSDVELIFAPKTSTLHRDVK